jgi:hypothetical protein
MKKEKNSKLNFKSTTVVQLTSKELALVNGKAASGGNQNKLLLSNSVQLTHSGPTKAPSRTK